MNSSLANPTIFSSSSSLLVCIFGSVNYEENLVIASFMIHWKVGEIAGTVAEIIVEVSGGDEGGSGGTIKVSMVMLNSLHPW